MELNQSDDDESEAPCLIEIPEDSKKVIPVTILSGFLGSGKTTLLNFILTNNHGKRIAVVENEFSAGLGIESMIAKSGVDGDNISNFFELSNGCICCTVKDDLLSTLEQLVLHKDRFDYILIETTGLANPGPVISSFWTDDELGSVLKLDGVICLVDCYNIENYLESPEIRNDVKVQICFADRILINKVDLVSSEHIIRVKKLLTEMNSVALIQESSYAKIDLNFVLNTESYSSQLKNPDLSINDFNFIQCGACDEKDTGKMIKNFMPLMIDDGNHAASSMKTEAFKIPGRFNLKSLNLLLDRLLYANGTKSDKNHGNKKIENDKIMNIYRMKGVFYVENDNFLYILQAVHEIFEINKSDYLIGGEKDKTKGQNLFIVIGSHIDSHYIEEQLVKCIV